MTLHHYDQDGRTPILIQPASPFSYLSAGSANQDSQIVSAVGGRIHGYSLHNTNASAIRWVKFYDKATPPTSADTPILRFALAPGGGGMVRECPYGVKFTNGLSIRITVNAADTDANAAAANEVAVNIDWIAP